MIRGEWIFWSVVAVLLFFGGTDTGKLIVNRMTAPAACPSIPPK